MTKFPLVGLTPPVRRVREKIIEFLDFWPYLGIRLPEIGCLDFLIFFISGCLYFFGFLAISREQKELPAGVKTDFEGFSVTCMGHTS